MMVSKENAYTVVRHYIVALGYARDKVRKNFEDMDLENVKIRDEMEKEIADIETAVNTAIKQLYALTFE